MSNIIHCPAGVLASPANVTDQADDLVVQGFIVTRIYYGQCPEPQFIGKSGWCIAFQNTQKRWTAWVFDSDPLAESKAVSVNVEVC